MQTFIFVVPFLIAVVVAIWNLDVLLYSINSKSKKERITSKNPSIHL